MIYPDIVFHGATQGVTGSCHELRVDGDHSILIDCGLFQGDESHALEIDFPVGQIKALVLTHVHIDHVGRIPYLLAAGFNGPIYCSQATAALLPLMLEDAVKIGFTKNHRLIEQFLNKINALLRPVKYGQWQDIPVDAAPLRIKLKPAGHVLGSAYVECDCAGKRLVFSGDLGAPYAPLLPAPKSPYRADILVLESTYGDRCHPLRRDRRQQLQHIIEKSLENRGAVLIPAFSLGRTQELLYELEEIIFRSKGRNATAGLPWHDLEIIVDSPLASRFTELFRQLKPFWDAEARKKEAAGRHPLSFEQLTTIGSHADHLHTVKYLKKTGRPCIVIAGGGMCNGGRIVNYLKALLGDERTDVVFVGYQAAGTPGRALQEYGPKHGYVVLENQRFPIAAAVHNLSGYSAHADQHNLVNFVRRMRRKPEKIYLVHGDAAAKSALKDQLSLLSARIEIVIAGS